MVKIIKLLKVSAYTNGREEVDESDVMLLIHCLWNDSNNAEKTGKVVTDLVRKNKLIGDKKKSMIELKGNGTKLSPFLIENVNDLKRINTDEILENSYYFKQTQDIDLGEINEWNSIGTNISVFKGHYDGARKKILNLKGNALFDIIAEKGVLENIIIENVNLTENLNQSNGTVGTLANLNNGKVLCIELRNANITINGRYIGGIIGCNKGEISNVKIIGYINLFSRGSYTGGITGINEGEIKNIMQKGIIRGYTTERYMEIISSYTGGIIGFNEGKILNSIIISEEISGGGLVGRVFFTNIEDCKGMNNYVCMSKSKIKSNDSNSFHGKDINIKELDEKFYREVLNWDFNNIWNWDSVINEPLLIKMEEDIYEIEENKNKIGGNFNPKNIFEANIWL